jgi:hypothetical protein
MFHAVMENVIDIDIHQPKRYRTIAVKHAVSVGELNAMAIFQTSIDNNRRNVNHGTMHSRTNSLNKKR